MTRILLGAGASAALFKACDLASKLTQDGHEVRAVLTPGAAKLIDPQLFEALTGQPAQVDEFGAERRGGMDHIELGRWAGLFVVAPCSADLLSRLALGLANDLLTTAALVLEPSTPRFVAPAMNPKMLAAAPIQRNLATLRGDGWNVLEPGEGAMACGDEGAGRLMEPADIAEALRASLG